MEFTAVQLSAMTLPELLDANPLGTEDEKLMKLFMAQYDEADKVAYDDPEIPVAVKTVGDILEGIQAKTPEKMKLFAGLDPEKAEDRVKIAAFIGVTAEMMERYQKGVEIRLEKMRASTTNADIYRIVDAQKKLWTDLKDNAPIKMLGKADFPIVIPRGEKPVIVFFSGDHCMPCHMRKPSYALLAKFFTGATLAFCNDIPKDKVHIEYVPHLIMWNAVGGKLHADLPSTTKEFFELLGKMVLHGEFTVEELMLEVSEDGTETLAPHKKS